MLEWQQSAATELRLKRTALRLLMALILHSSLLTLHSSAQGIITTVAGTTWVFRGDGGAATNAPLGSLPGVTVDSAGNVFAADSGNHVVVRISPSGVLTVVAGNGIAGFSGDGRLATGASLRNPTGVAVDAQGNIYIVDRNNHRIRKVTQGGTISTVAGTGQFGSGGDGGPATRASLGNPFAVAIDSLGNLYIAQRFANVVRKVRPDGTITTVAGNRTVGFSGDGGPATGALLNGPRGVAVDAAGNLFVADQGNNRIRKISAGGIITTVAGNGTAGFSGDGGPATSAALRSPAELAVDAAGALYAADSGNHRIRRVSAGGTIATVAGNGLQNFSGDGGPAIGASLNSPAGVAADAAGTLFIADDGNARIRKVSQGGTITTLAGNGLFKFAEDGFLYFPLHMAVDAGNVYIADTLNNRIRKVSPDGVITTLAGTGRSRDFSFSGDGGPATSARLGFPSAVTLDGQGNLFVADQGNNRIRKISPSGIITTLAGNGVAAFGGDGGPATEASLNQPGGVALDSAGNLFIGDQVNNRVRKVSPSGIITTVAGSGPVSPAFCGGGFAGDGGPATSALLNAPAGLALDASGDLYFADICNNRIRKVSPDGRISTVAGNGVEGFSGDGGPATSASLAGPNYVAVDAAGSLYVADGGNNRIRKISPGGIISTAAGNGVEGFSGDCGPATNASLNGPGGVAVDIAGNIYIADTGNDRIRKVSFASSLAPNLPPDSVVNAASFRPATDPNGGVAPGATVAIFGANLAPATQVALAVPLSSALLDSCVTFSAGGSIFPAPLFFVSGGQINAQVPFEVPPGTVSVQVRRGDQTSAAQPVTVAAVSPGLFTLNQRGAGAGMILHADSFELVSESNPARPGEFLSIFATGLGLVQPPVPSGQRARGTPPLAETMSTPQVNIAGIPAPVSFSGLAPGFVGLYQVNVQVPMEVPAGTQPVQIIVNGVPSNTVTIEVAQ